MLFLLDFPHGKNGSENLSIYCTSTAQPPPQPDDIALAGVVVSAVDSPQTVGNLLGGRGMVEGVSGSYAHTSPTLWIRLLENHFSTFA